MNVFIVESSHSYVKMWEDRGFKVVSRLEEADVIQFTGGADVSPYLYDEEIHPAATCSVRRDAREADIYKRAVKWSIPVTGICRGAQFLNVMNGGKMNQHVDGHAISNTHLLIGDDGREVEVTSTHHQMMIAGDKGDVLAVAYESSFREGMKDKAIKRVLGDHEDTEVVYYNTTKSLCFQPHPEYLDKKHPCQEYYFDLLEMHLGVK